MQTFKPLHAEAKEPKTNMCKNKLTSALFSILFLATTGIFSACTSPATDIPEVVEARQEATAEAAKDGSKEEKEALIKRGKYLMVIGACHDCHSPKVMTPQGPAIDSTRLLSGHPAGETIPPVVASQDWVLFNQGLTAFVGPWGVSYAANLTPDITGTGRWTYEQFETAIRKGKSKGLERGRDLLPPMPWQMYREMTDQDLRAIFAYLKSIKPVSNLVPSPIAPDNMTVAEK